MIDTCDLKLHGIHFKNACTNAKRCDSERAAFNLRADGNLPDSHLSVNWEIAETESFALDNPKPAEISHVRSWTEHMRFGRVVMWKRTVSNATEWNYRKGICSGESSVQFELGEVCHAKSQFGLATQMGVCACYTTRSLTGGIGGFNGTHPGAFLNKHWLVSESSRHRWWHPVTNEPSK